MSNMAALAGKTICVVLLAGLVIGASGCANTNNRDEDTRGASLLILDSLTAESGDGSAPGSGTGDSALFSDVLSCDDDGLNCGIWNDNGFAAFRNESLNPTTTDSYFQDIQMYRLRVQYTRADGRNTEGVDVPYAFDSVMAMTVGIGQTATAGFVIVRHVAKEERPLVDLIGLGDESIISTNTRCDFWGRDIAGNEHHVFGWIDIEFGDFG